ncbi:MAG: phosphate acyltransferase PlsX [FCB group bacterium]|nr:phosphate acyltransferase PlsX [FCB group bacterium]
MILALDAMGGDFAPEAIVQGALQALSETPDSVKLILVGDEQAIDKELPHPIPDRLSIFPTTQVVSMSDRASKVIKTKPDSSLVRGIKLVKEGQADGFISAGNTGAMLAASLLLLGRIPNVHRPALSVYIPTNTRGKILCDVGANPDAKPLHLLQFAIMAAHYLEHVEGCKNPRIGLINIGEEPNKGSELYQETHQLLKAELPNFIGNIEGRHLLDSPADVLVCDGFVGNTLLKFGESWISIFESEIKDKIRKKLFYQLGALILKPVFREIRKKFDYEEHGGTPLLGVNGVSIVAHGSSGPKSIKNSIQVAIKCIDFNLIEDTRIGLAEHIGANR